MTIPYQHNCPHSDNSWCLDCVQELAEELKEERRDAERFRFLLKKGISWNHKGSLMLLYDYDHSIAVIDAAIKTEASFSKTL